MRPRLETEVTNTVCDTLVKVARDTSALMQTYAIQTATANSTVAGMVQAATFYSCALTSLAVIA